LEKKNTRINCNVNGEPAKILHELKERGVIQTNREAVIQGFLALKEKIVRLDLEKATLKTLTEQRVYLRPWEEIVGTLTGIEISDLETTALLTCTTRKHIAITLPKDQTDSTQLQQLIGKKIGILKTEDPERPLAIRTFTETTDARNPTAWNRQLRRSLLSYAFKGYALKFSLWLSELRLSWWF
jgi:hypothetical protein